MSISTTTVTIVSSNVGLSFKVILWVRSFGLRVRIVGVYSLILEDGYYRALKEVQRFSFFFIFGRPCFNLFFGWTKFQSLWFLEGFGVQFWWTNLLRFEVRHFRFERFRSLLLYNLGSIQHLYLLVSSRSTLNKKCIQLNCIISNQFPNTLFFALLPDDKILYQLFSVFFLLLFFFL